MNEITPYLCGGTFLTQLIEAGRPKKSAREHASGQKESHREHDVFRWLISVYQREEYADAGDTLKTYASQYKKCQKSYYASSFIGFGDRFLVTEFDRDVKSDPSAALYMMSELINHVIAPSNSNYARLARRLLGLIKCDTTIPEEDIFYLSQRPITKAELVVSTEINLAPFLLAIWHYIILRRANKNENGAATYQAWFPQDGSNYSGDVALEISKPPHVEFHPLSRPEDDFQQKEKPHPSIECEVDEEDAQASEKQELHQTLNLNIVNQDGLVNYSIGHIEVHPDGNSRR